MSPRAATARWTSRALTVVSWIPSDSGVRASGHRRALLISGDIPIVFEFGGGRTAVVPRRSLEVVP